MNVGKYDYFILTRDDWFLNNYRYHKWEDGIYSINPPCHLKLMGILQEMLLKRMDSLWKMTQEMQNNRNQETKKIRSLEVRKSMLYFLYGDGYNSSLTFSEILVST